MSASSFENRWRLEADNRFFWTSQPSYGLGTDTTDAAKLDMKFNHFRIFDKYYHQVRRNLFLGAGYDYNIHNNVRPGEDVDPDVFAESPYIAYSEQFGFDLDSQTSTPPTPRPGRAAGQTSSSCGRCAGASATTAGGSA